jgi:hypothetical protein
MALVGLARLIHGMESIFFLRRVLTDICNSKKFALESKIKRDAVNTVNNPGQESAR